MYVPGPGSGLLTLDPRGSLERKNAADISYNSGIMRNMFGQTHSPPRKSPNWKNSFAFLDELLGYLQQ